GNAVKSKPQLLVCILPTTGTPLYAEVKRVTDTIIGVASQCLQMKHVHEPKKQYCANVCLKINAKLGGINSQLQQHMMPFLTSKPTILLGGDVSHPHPGKGVIPSLFLSSDRIVVIELPSSCYSNLIDSILHYHNP